MFIRTFSLSWVLVLGLAAAAAWLEYWLVKPEYSAEIQPESVGHGVADRSVHGRTRATLH